MVGRRVLLAGACSGSVLLAGCLSSQGLGQGAPPDASLPQGYGGQGQPGPVAPGSGYDGSVAQGYGSPGAAQDGGDPGQAQEYGDPAAAAGGDPGGAQGYGDPAAAGGDGGVGAAYGDPSPAGQGTGYPPQPPVYGYPAYGYPGGGYPGYGDPGGTFSAGPGPGQAYVGPDGLTYVDGVPIGLIQGETVPFLFIGQQGGWGYYDRGRQWHDAPPDVRDRLERFHPGGRGLPPPAIARGRFDRPLVGPQGRPPFAGGPGPGGGRPPRDVTRDVPGGPAVFRGGGERGEAGRPVERELVPDPRAELGRGGPPARFDREQAAERFREAPPIQLRQTGPGQGGAGGQGPVQQGFPGRGPGGPPPGQLRSPPPPRPAPPPFQGRAPGQQHP